MSWNLNSQRKQVWCIKKKKKPLHYSNHICQHRLKQDLGSLTSACPSPWQPSTGLPAATTQPQRSGRMENPTAGELSHPGAPRAGKVPAAAWRMRGARQLIPAESSAWAQLMCQSLSPSCIWSVLPAVPCRRNCFWKWTGVNAAPNSRAAGARAAENSSRPFTAGSLRAGSFSLLLGVFGSLLPSVDFSVCFQ